MHGTASEFAFPPFPFPFPFPFPPPFPSFLVLPLPPKCSSQGTSRAFWGAVTLLDQNTVESGYQAHIRYLAHITY